MKRQKTHIITGATGFLGNNLVREFLSRGDNLILFVRGKDGVSAEDRIINIFKFSNKEMNHIKVFDIDLLKPISKQVSIKKINEEFGNVDDIWHLAAQLSFKEKNREITISTNVGGTKKISELAQELKVRLFYFSTAYMHGKRAGTLRENEIIKSRYNNPYEESKYLTEKYLHNEIKNGLMCTIFRPSIIFDAIPKRRQGYVSGYYVMLLSLSQMKNGLSMIHGKHSVLLKLFGIHKTNGKIISRFIPYVVTNSSINLISVQDVLSITLSIYDKQGSMTNTVYHVVSPTGISMKKLTKIMFETLGFEVKIVVAPKFVVRAMLSLIHLLGKVNCLFTSFANKIGYYEFYLINTYMFDLNNINLVFGEDKYNNLFIDEDSILRNSSDRFIKMW